MIAAVGIQDGAITDSVAWLYLNTQSNTNMNLNLTQETSSRMK